MTTLLASVSGLGTGLALIVAIGAQNAYLLRLAIGAPIRTVTAAVCICAGSDALLIAAGALGVGAVVERVPGALVVVRLVGAAFLLAYGVLAARRAIVGGEGALRVDTGGLAEPGFGQGTAEQRGAVSGTWFRREDARVAVLTMLAFTWANPHVYLDTLVFLGSLANQQGTELRWWWIGGAVGASCLWFAGIGFGGRALRPVFAKPLAWRVFDGCVAVVMLAFAAKLLLGG